jgi:hypothetical protein
MGALTGHAQLIANSRYQFGDKKSPGKWGGPCRDSSTSEGTVDGRLPPRVSTVTYSVTTMCHLWKIKTPKPTHLVLPLCIGLGLRLRLRAERRPAVQWPLSIRCKEHFSTVQNPRSLDGPDANSNTRSRPGTDFAVAKFWAKSKAAMTFPCATFVSQAR